MQLTGQGFLLSRQHYNTSKGVVVELWIKDKEQVYQLSCRPEPVVFFIREQDRHAASECLSSWRGEIKPLSLASFEHEVVCGVYFSSSWNLSQAARALTELGIPHFEADIRPSDRFLMERFVRGGLAFSGVATQESGYIQVRDARVKQADVDLAFTQVSLDIECSEKGELYSIGLYSELGEWVFMRGKPEEGPEYIHWCDSEASLIRALISWLAQYDPDIIIGWAVASFDMRLLIKRAQACDIAPAFGRGGNLATWRDSKQVRGFLEIPGRIVIDGIEGLKSATWQFESYSLEHVAGELLGRGKQAKDVDNRMAEINHNFRHNKPALAAYNLEDCRLVWDIFKLTHLTEYLAQRARLTGLELDRSGGSVASFTNLYLPKVHRAGYVAPNLPAGGGLASPGGYVMDSKPGLYKNVLVLDYKSLYPSIIRTFKIDPVGLIEGLKSPDDAIPGFLDAKFSRNTHYLPDIITGLWQARDEAKKARDKAATQAIKIIMNSFYGVLGSGGCRFYDPRLASSITLRGQEIMKQTRSWIEEAGFTVIYGDTDSTFVLLPEGHGADADETGTKLATQINSKWQQLLVAEFGLSSCLEMEYETHYRHFFMPTIRGTEKGSKKRYAGIVLEDGKENLVFKGLETVRSDWTPLAKSFQTRLYKMVFAGEPVDTYIRELVDEVRKGSFNKELVYKKRLRRPLNEYTKNVPPHVRAARLADEQLSRDGKSRRYQKKGSVSYMITLNGPEPVEYLHSQPDFQHYIDKQLKPIADAILPFIGQNFDHIIDEQLGLF